MSRGNWLSRCLRSHGSGKINVADLQHPAELVLKAFGGFCRLVRRGDFYPTSFLHPLLAGDG